MDFINIAKRWRYHDYGPDILKAMHNKSATKKEELTDFDGLRELVKIEIKNSSEIF